MALLTKNKLLKGGIARTRNIAPAFLVLLLLCSACSTVVPAVSPTAITTPTPPPPTHTPTPTFTPMPTPVPDGPCDNPLIPLVQGNRWEYQASSTGGITRQIVTIGAVGDDRAEVEMQDPDTGQTIKDVTFCDDGEIANFPIIITSLLLANYMEGVLNTYRIEGVYAPSYITLTGNDWGYSWETIYLTESEVVVHVPGSTAVGAIGFNSRLRYEWQMENVHAEVTVPAGNFPQALKVTQSMRVPITISGLPGFQGGASLVMESQQWYEPYVGLVKAEVTSTKILMSGDFEYPVAIDTVIELMGIAPGQ